MAKQQPTTGPRKHKRAIAPTPATRRGKRGSNASGAAPTNMTKVIEPNDEWEQAIRETERAADTICDVLAALEYGLPERVPVSQAMEWLAEEIARREPTLAEQLGLQGENIEIDRPFALLMERRSWFRIRTATLRGRMPSLKSQLRCGVSGKHPQRRLAAGGKASPKGPDKSAP